MKNLLSRKEFLLVFFFFIAVLALLYYTFFTSNYYEGSSPKRFEIKYGETLSSIADSLERQHIIPGSTRFIIAAFIYGAEKSIKAGRYNIPNGLSYLGLIEYFLNGKADYLRTVSFPGGSTIRYLGAKVRYELFVDSAAFVQKARDRSLIDSLGLNTSSLEGYLFPDSYHAYERSSPSELIGIFYKGFEKFMVDSLKRRAESTGYSIHQILTLASIVEGETNTVEEMPVIASVYLNRLKKGMRLEADPTIQYLQSGGWKRLTYEDLKVKSPYNTYLYTGLPPGPINNPGRDAILAVLYPAATDYLFFVANGKGGHSFSKTYSQHLKNVNNFRRWLKQQQKK